MKRSQIKPGKGFKQRATPMARGTGALKTHKPLQARSSIKAASKPMAAIGARGKRMRQGKVAPTAEEAAWMDKAAHFGCIVCFKQTGVRTVAEIHHLKQGDRRMGHLFTLPLCYWHHRGGDKDGPYISRHPWKTRFEEAYGTELDLLAELRALLNGDST